MAEGSSNDSDRPVEKRVEWAELFFDLVFVFAITEVSSLVDRDRTWAGVVRAAIVFVPIYWVWVGTTIQTDVGDMSGAAMRVTVFAVALGGLLMALAVPEAYAGRPLLFAIAYWLARTLIGVVLVRGSPWSINPVTVSIAVTGPLLVLGAIGHGTVREALWAVAAVIDLSTPAVLRSRLQGMHFDARHLAERFGLFVLIAVGEMVVAIGAAAQQADPLTVGVVCALVAGFVVVCGLWWVYFHFAADAVRHALATAPIQLDITRRVLSYGHLSFIASIIAIAAGLLDAVEAPGDHLGAGSVGLLFGGTALYLATFGYTRWSMFKLVSVTRLTAAAVVAVLTPVALHVPALVALVILAVLLIVLNAEELRRVEQIGWRARLDRRRAG